MAAPRHQTVAGQSRGAQDERWACPRSAHGLGRRASSGLWAPHDLVVGSDYAAYVADALKQDPILAGKLDVKPATVIACALVSGDMSAGGFVTNSGEIEARFDVTRNGEQRYSQVKRADLSWESSFIAALAIPNTQQQYQLSLQTLVSLPLADGGFLAAPWDWEPALRSIRVPAANRRSDPGAGLLLPPDIAQPRVGRRHALGQADNPHEGLPHDDRRQQEGSR